MLMICSQLPATLLLPADRLDSRPRMSGCTPFRSGRQGNRLVRWAAVEAAQKLRTDTHLHSWREALAERRNSRQIAKVAAARKIITLVYYGLRDGHIRCLQPRRPVELAAA